MKKAFTLVEVMIIVAIIGLLTAIAIPAFIQYRNDINSFEIGVSLINAKGCNLAGYTAKFEYVRLSNDCTSIEEEFGVIDLNGITLATWEKLNHKERLRWMRPMGTTITTFKKEESKVAKTNPNETVLTIAGTPEVLIVNGTKYYREDAIREHKDAMPEVKLDRKSVV